MKKLNPLLPELPKFEGPGKTDSPDDSAEQLDLF